MGQRRPNTPDGWAERSPPHRQSPDYGWSRSRHPTPGSVISSFGRLDGEACTIGIVLCSEKNEAMVRITLPENNEQIHTARYQQCLPSEDELRERLSRDREDAEGVLEREQ